MQKDWGREGERGDKEKKRVSAPEGQGCPHGPSGSSVCSLPAREPAQLPERLLARLRAQEPGQRQWALGQQLQYPGQGRSGDPVRRDRCGKGGSSRSFGFSEIVSVLMRSELCLKASI